MRTRLLASLAVAVLVSSACGSTAPSAPSAPVGNAKEGGTLVVALSGDIASADPALSDDTNVFYVANQTVQGLLGLEPGTIAGVVPVLAADLPTASADGLTYTFTLRTGIKFHDGTVFDSAAVKYNYERQANLPEALQSLDYYYGTVFGGYGTDSNIASIDTPDASTVVFRLKHPQSNFLIAQTVASFGIQSPTALEKGDADNPDPSKSTYYTGQGNGFVGTGPFVFKEWVPNDHVTLIKNPDYWDFGQRRPSRLGDLQALPGSDSRAERPAVG